MNNMNNEKNLRVLSDGTIIKRLLQYMKGHYKTFFIAFSLMIIAVLLDTTLPLLVMQALEELDKDVIVFSNIALLIVAYGVLMLVSYVIQFTQSLMLQKMGQSIMYKVREDVFVAIESLSIAQLYEVPVGKLVTRVTSDTNALNEMYTTIIINLVKNI